MTFLSGLQREREKADTLALPSISSNDSVIHSHLFTILTFILLLCIFHFTFFR